MGTVDVKALVAITSVLFLAIVGALLLRSVRAGRALADTLERRFPDIYIELGRPRPTFFLSPRNNRFMRFVMSREYLGIDDKELILRFEAHRQLELQLLRFLVGGIVTLGIAAALVNMSH